jgi:hypothetical protein
MTTPPDLDPQLESLQEELRAQLAALNELHHPVYPADPRRIAELTERIAGLQADLTARRKELRARAPATAPAPAAVATAAAKVGV